MAEWIPFEDMHNGVAYSNARPSSNFIDTLEKLDSYLAGNPEMLITPEDINIDATSDARGGEYILLVSDERGYEIRYTSEWLKLRECDDAYKDIDEFIGRVGRIAVFSSSHVQLFEHEGKLFSRGLLLREKSVAMTMLHDNFKLKYQNRGEDEQTILLRRFVGIQSHDPEKGVEQFVDAEGFFSARALRTAAFDLCESKSSPGSE